MRGRRYLDRVCGENSGGWWELERGSSKQYARTGSNHSTIVVHHQTPFEKLTGLMKPGHMVSGGNWKQSLTLFALGLRIHSCPLCALLSASGKEEGKATAAPPPLHPPSPK